MDVRNKSEHEAEFVNFHMDELETLTSVEILRNVTYKGAFIRYISTKDTVDHRHYSEKKYIHAYSLCGNVQDHIYLLRKPNIIWTLAGHTRNREEKIRFVDKMGEYVRRNFKKGMIRELENLKMSIVEMLKETGFQNFCCMHEKEREELEDIFRSIYSDIYR